MRRLRTVPLGVAAGLMAAILAVAGVAPHLGAGAALAAPAAFDAMFRDLPASVRTGDPLMVQVQVPGGATCEGSITYRDNTVQKLAKIEEDDDLCRWDVVVPDETRRGEADVVVTVTHDLDQIVLTALVDVVRRSSSLDLSLQKLPGVVRRGDEFTIRLDVADDTTCQGGITYDDGRTQALEAQTEQKGRCRWILTVPADAARGPAQVRITVSQGNNQTTFATSFEVGRREEDAELLIGFQDLPASVRRNTAVPIRLLVPEGATCTGELSVRGAENVMLEEVEEENGLCRWSARVPSDAKRGDADVRATVKADGKEASITAYISVEGSSSDVAAAFTDLPRTVRRGEEFELRVDVPDGATCAGNVTYDDGETQTLGEKAEKKERCRWEVKVPSSAPRGTAIVRVWVTEDGVQTALVANIDVESKDDEFKANVSALPKTVRPGEKFQVRIDVASGSSCVGRISFADGLTWRLGNTDEKSSKCSWDVDLPPHVGAGKANVEVTVERGNRSKTVKSSFEVTAS